MGRGGCGGDVTGQDAAHGLELELPRQRTQLGHKDSTRRLPGLDGIQLVHDAAVEAQPDHFAQCGQRRGVWPDAGLGHSNHRGCGAGGWGGRCVGPHQCQAALQPVEQFAVAQRFADEILRLDADVVFQRLVERIGRDVGYVDTGVYGLPETTDGLPAVDSGHGQDHKHHVRLVKRG